MRLTFWGTRGSVPTPGKSTVRYGGNTPCVEVRLDGDELIILDAGTGIRNLGEELMSRGSPVKAYVLVSHPHWDHIQGFPFFRPAFHPGNEVTIVGGESEKVTLEKMISDQMNRVYFPIQLEELKANLLFLRVAEHEVKIFDATVKTIYVNHPTFAMGYRIEYKGRSLVYISDNEPFDPENIAMVRNIDPRVAQLYLSTNGDPNQRVHDFVRDADVLIHDTTYTPEEYESHVGWGHSHYIFTLRTAAAGNVKKLVLFHHDPAHSDELVDSILDKCREEIRNKGYAFECVAAYEGMKFGIP